jgi:hypothetical protein
MKTLFSLSIFFIFIYYTHAQGCLPEGITFTTQAQINNFQTNYPGCTEIEGNVMIGDINGICDITNLNGLSVLTSIGGRLSIGIINTLTLPNLTSLSGLENLTSIGGSLIVFSIPLTNMSGLEGLTSIGDSLYITFNNSLTSLTGLNNLNSVGGSVFIGHIGNPWWDNPILASLTGLENLTSIGNKLFIGNTALSSMAGLENLTSIGDGLIIGLPEWSANALLTSLTGLENLTSIGHYLTIDNNNALISLKGLDNIDPGSITQIDIRYNSSLSTCNIQSICEYIANPNSTVNISDNATGCNSDNEVSIACETHCLPDGIIFTTQSQIDSFQENYPDCSVIEGNVKIIDSLGSGNITNLNGLNILTSIGGSLSIGALVVPLPNLTSLSGLENLTSIGGSLEILSLPLTNLTGLEGLASIGDNLAIIDNQLLTSLIGLNNLITVGGGVYIGRVIGGNPPFDNPALASLTGLENLTSIGEKLVIGNTALSNMMGLENLTSIGDDLIIAPSELGGNTLLTSLTGLEKLTSIGRYLIIDHNNALISLTGLDNINSGSIIGLTIQNNPLLSLCKVQSICNYLASPNAFVGINDNATGCNTRGEVQSACDVGIDENNGFNDEINVYPNPASNKITIQTSTTPIKFELSILNINGKELISRLITESKTQIDINNLSNGVYFVRTTGEKTVQFGKFVKQF